VVRFYAMTQKFAPPFVILMHPARKPDLRGGLGLISSSGSA
jgi:hypothetical protein